MGRSEGAEARVRAMPPATETPSRTVEPAYMLLDKTGTLVGVGCMPRFRRSSSQKDINSRRRHAQTHVEE
eukprot:scaffold2213_cov118-Cylindrotheca_fusiformis.AAC.1